MIYNKQIKKNRSRDDKFSTDKPLLFSLSFKSLPISAQILRVHNGLFKGPAPGFNMPKNTHFRYLFIGDIYPKRPSCDVSKQPF